MPVKPLEFLASAKNLMSSNNEISYRNATSRAYYAAYHEAQRISQYSNFTNTNKKGSHEKLIEKLIKHSGSDAKSQSIRKIGILLSQCKKERVNADYKINSPFWRLSTDVIILTVEQILQLSTSFP